MAVGRVMANGREVEGDFPCTLATFLEGQDLLPRSVVVEHNGEAIPPSGFASTQVNAGDRLEIVRIVAGG